MSQIVTVSGSQLTYPPGQRVKNALMYEYRCRKKKNTLRYKPEDKSRAATVDSTAEDGAAGAVQSRAASQPVGPRTGAGADILKLFMAKAPKRMQAHMCWLETVDQDAAFDAAVDARLEELTLKAAEDGTNPPPRQGAVASVAAELFKKADAQTKKDVSEKVAKAHGEDMKKWLARKSEEPESPEDAAQWVDLLVLSPCMADSAYVSLQVPGGCARAVGRPCRFRSRARIGRLRMVHLRA